MSEEIHERWMCAALKLARRAGNQGEVPVGAVIVQNDKIIGSGYNQPITSCDATGHAEIQAIRNAGIATQNYRLPGATLYVTIEPCTMCLGAIVHARLSQVVFGACEPKAGVLKSNPVLLRENIFNHTFEWLGGVCESQCAEEMQNFFSFRRSAKKALKNNSAFSKDESED
ncbi:tRNA(adenine34) deaminase [Alteromonadaceae bacterium 2753L.S.0a.02]|nr:tRNA(adenine34) deaminase [Alteromonadaceae bacterium 2753L.S.0a.02]